MQRGWRSALPCWHGLRNATIRARRLAELHTLNIEGALNSLTHKTKCDCYLRRGWRSALPYWYELRDAIFRARRLKMCTTPIVEIIVRLTFELFIEIPS